MKEGRFESVWQLVALRELYKICDHKGGRRGKGKIPSFFVNIIYERPKNNFPKTANTAQNYFMSTFYNFPAPYCSNIFITNTGGTISLIIFIILTAQYCTH